MKNEKKLKIAPSLLSADFSDFRSAAARAAAAGADMLHCDVMDGHFVPNITFGPKMVADLRRVTDLPLDVHLMVTDPETYAPRFLEAGADIVTFHVEAVPEEDGQLRLLSVIHAAGRKGGVVLNPHTPLDRLTDGVLENCDMVLLMSVQPGFGGQSFIESVHEKLRALRLRVQRTGLPVDIEVDGGITLANAKDAAADGATVLVAGTAVFGAPDMTSAIKALRA
ncbi:MAG: ribulose-phosphate 3-epimerase [Clostridiales bacterium]|nr:ribulose-phosphate 3-epimerase [Clostridiales bacterium]